MSVHFVISHLNTWEARISFSGMLHMIENVKIVNLKDNSFLIITLPYT
jgi:hypothetical protein